MKGKSYEGRLSRTIISEAQDVTSLITIYLGRQQVKIEVQKRC